MLSKSSQNIIKSNITSNTHKLREKSLEDDTSRSSISYACKNAYEPNVSTQEEKEQDEQSEPLLHKWGKACSVEMASKLHLNKSSISL